MTTALVRKAFIDTFLVFRSNYPARWGSMSNRDDIRQSDNKVTVEIWLKELYAIEATDREVRKATETTLKLSKFSTYPPSVQDFMQIIKLGRYIGEQKEKGIEIDHIMRAVEFINEDFASRYGSKWQIRENYLLFLKNWSIEILKMGITVSDIKKAINSITVYPKLRSYAPTLNEFIELCLLVKLPNPPPVPMVAVNKISSIQDVKDLHPLIVATLNDIDYQKIHHDKEKLTKAFLWQYSDNFTDYINGNITIEKDEFSSDIEVSHTKCDNDILEEVISPDALAQVLKNI